MRLSALALLALPLTALAQTAPDSAFAVPGAARQEAGVAADGYGQPMPGRYPFQPGWYIVEACAEYTVVRPSNGERDSYRGTISTGEPVLAFDQVSEGTLVFEAFGRMSLIRDARCLTPAPAGGRPAYVTEDIQMFDGVIREHTVAWVTDVDPVTESATLAIEAGDEVRVPVSRLQFMRTYLPVRPAARRGWRDVNAR